MIVRRPVQWRFQHSFFCSSDLWRKNISFLIALYCAACICSSFITYASKAPHYCASDFPFEGLHATIFNSWTNPTLLFLFADSLSTFYFKLRVDHFFVVLLEHISLLWQTPSIFFSNEASCESRWTSWLRDLYEDFNTAFVDSICGRKNISFLTRLVCMPMQLIFHHSALPIYTQWPPSYFEHASMSIV
jgi:hypothetical protein